jgi:hypothetical protein
MQEVDNFPLKQQDVISLASLQAKSDSKEDTDEK